MAFLTNLVLVILFLASVPLKLGFPTCYDKDRIDQLNLSEYLDEPPPGMMLATDLKILDHSFETQCTEVDNIYTSVAHPGPNSVRGGRMRISVTPPFVSSELDNREANWTNCDDMSPPRPLFRVGKPDFSNEEFGNPAGWDAWPEYFALTPDAEFYGEGCTSLATPSFRSFPSEINHDWFPHALILFSARGSHEHGITADIGGTLTIRFSRVGMGVIRLKLMVAHRAPDGSRPTVWISPTETIPPAWTGGTVSFEIPDGYYLSGCFVNEFHLDAEESDQFAYALFDSVEYETREVKKDVSRVLIPDNPDFRVIATTNEDFWLELDPTTTGSFSLCVRETPDAECIAWQGVVNFFALQVRIPGTIDDFPQVFVLYADGNIRLLPFPPDGSPPGYWVPFGSSIQLGRLLGSSRPYIHVKHVAINLDRISISVEFEDDHTVELFLDASRERLIVDVLSVKTDFFWAPNGVFHLRGMSTFEGNSDLDAIYTGNELVSFPDFESLTGSYWFVCFIRRCESMHNSKSPDICVAIYLDSCEPSCRDDGGAVCKFPDGVPTCSCSSDLVNGTCPCKFNYESHVGVCDDYMCEDGLWKHESDGAECSGHGTCSESSRTCVCDQNWGHQDGQFCNVCLGNLEHRYEEFCNDFKCEDGLWVDEPFGCSGHGTCTAQSRDCLCDDNYENEGDGFCNDFRCEDGRFMLSEADVCSGHGNCSSSSDVCVCELNWEHYGKGKCNDYKCEDGFWVLHQRNEKRYPCSGHGTCDIVSNVCNCELGFESRDGGYCNYHATTAWTTKSTNYVAILIAGSVTVSLVLVAMLVCVCLILWIRGRIRQGRSNPSEGELCAYRLIHDPSCIKHLSRLATGGFSAVFLSELTIGESKNGPIIVTVASKEGYLSETVTREMVLQECVRLASLNHEGVVRCHGCFFDEDSGCPGEVRFGILMENCELGEVGKWTLQNRPSKLFRCSLLSEIASAMSYLHAEQMIHRDLKPANVVLSSDRRAKICDFGFAKWLGTPKSQIVGTMPYSPPESLVSDRHQVIDQTKHDVYSFGIMAWEIWTDQSMGALLQTKYYGETGFALLRRIHNEDHPIRPPIDPSIDNEFAEILQQCWEMDWRVRPTFDVIVAQLKEFRRSLKGDAASNSRPYAFVASVDVNDSDSDPVVVEEEQSAESTTDESTSEEGDLFIIVEEEEENSDAVTPKNDECCGEGTRVALLDEGKFVCHSKDVRSLSFDFVPPLGIVFNDDDEQRVDLEEIVELLEDSQRDGRQRRFEIVLEAGEEDERSDEREISVVLAEEDAEAFVAHFEKLSLTDHAC